MTKTFVLAFAVLFLAAGVLSLATFGVLLSRKQPAVQSETVHYQLPPSADADVLTEYELLDQSGAIFKSKNLEGKVHVVSFFFSRCPSVCWTQNQAVKKLSTEFGPQEVEFVSITCDPDYDSPPILQHYADRLAANPGYWSFLTGDLTYTRRIGSDIYKLPVDSQVHSEKLILVDKWGNVRGAYHYGNDLEKIETELTKLVAETEEPAIEPPVSEPRRAKTGLAPGEDDEPENLPPSGPAAPEPAAEETPEVDPSTEEEPPTPPRDSGSNALSPKVRTEFFTATEQMRIRDRTICEGFAKVKRGMTPEEVARLMSEPPTILPQGDVVADLELALASDRWHWSVSPYSQNDPSLRIRGYEVVFEKGRVSKTIVDGTHLTLQPIAR